MEITYLGHSSFKLKGKTASLVTDPYEAKVGFKFPKVEAEIVTVSHDHFDHNQADLVGGVRKIIAGPGEYEISGVSIIGLPSFHDNTKGSERGNNTIYVIEMDGLRLCHLGDLGHELLQATLDAIGTVDVLMVPVGGVYTIGPEEAARIVQSIEPSRVIPMHYKTPEYSEQFSQMSLVEEFLKSLGSPTENLPKLTLQKEDLADSELKVCVLEKK